jgi:LemA protein
MIIAEIVLIMVFLLVVVLIMCAIIFPLYLWGTYNGFITARNNIDKAWSNIDVLLKQRSDELPGLIASVKGYMRHEKEVLSSVTKARTQMVNARSLSDKASANEIITNGLKTIFAVAENYPRLRANENFLKLQERISGLENEIADRREFYNDSVTLYNIKTDSFPDLIMARIMKLTKKELFIASAYEKRSKKVEL